MTNNDQYELVLQEDRNKHTKSMLENYFRQFTFECVQSGLITGPIPKPCKGKLHTLLCTLCVRFKSLAEAINEGGRWGTVPKGIIKANEKCYIMWKMKENTKDSMKTEAKPNTPANRKTEDI